jgi:hypothetical protein
MFEVLNAEGKPEYIGFRKACEDLFPLFKKTFFLRDDSLLECLYDEDMMMMRIDVENATLFFWWCGVCKKSLVTLPQHTKCPQRTAYQRRERVSPSEVVSLDVTAKRAQNCMPNLFQGEGRYQDNPPLLGSGTETSGVIRCAAIPPSSARRVNAPFAMKCLVKRTYLDVLGL